MPTYKCWDWDRESESDATEWRTVDHVVAAEGWIEDVNEGDYRDYGAHRRTVDVLVKDVATGCEWIVSISASVEPCYYTEGCHRVTNDEPAEVVPLFKEVTE